MVEFLRITNELSYKLKKIDNDMNQMKINLKAANLFLNNDEKINDLIVKIKEVIFYLKKINLFRNYQKCNQV